MTKKLALVLVSIWWGWTVIIDFAVVPTVFRVIHDFFNAGELGIALFSKLNLFEILVSSLLIVLCVLNLKQYRKGKLELSLSISAWAIVMFYFAYLTPTITHYTKLWKVAEFSADGLVDYQQQHQFYHRLYIGLDSVKLLILTTLMSLNVFRKA